MTLANLFDLLHTFISNIHHLPSLGILLTAIEDHCFGLFFCAFFKEEIARNFEFFREFVALDILKERFDCFFFGCSQSHITYFFDIVLHHIDFEPRFACKSD